VVPGLVGPLRGLATTVDNTPWAAPPGDFRVTPWGGRPRKTHRHLRVGKPQRCSE